MSWVNYSTRKKGYKVEMVILGMGTPLCFRISHTTNSP